MAFQGNVELLNQAVQALADTAPPDWRKIIFYLEFLEDEEIGLRNKFTGNALGGENCDIRLDSCDLGGSMRTFNSIKALYQQAVQSGDKWTGILLTVLSTGKFKCRMFYEQTPLLAGNDAEVDRILSEGLSELSHN